MKRTGGLLLLCVLSVALLATGTAAHGESITEETVVTVDGDESVSVEITVVYDLTDETEREEFDRLSSSETALDDLQQRVRGDLEEGLSEDATLDSFRRSDIQRYDDDDKGVVVFNAEVNNAATVTGEEVVVTGFDEHTTQRQFRVTGDDGYAVRSSTPEALETGGDAVYPKDIPLDGFSVTLTPGGADPDSTPTTPITTIAAGMAVVAVLGILAVYWMKD